jgi:hypothetical protein
MRGAITPLPRYAFIAWCLIKQSAGTTLPLSLPLCIVLCVLSFFHLFIYLLRLQYFKYIMYNEANIYTGT